MKRGWMGLVEAIVLAMLAVPVAHAADAPTQTATFSITDELGDDQQSEEIAVSINGTPVGTLKIDGAKTKDMLTATVPVAGTYRYDLCGYLKLKPGNGTPLEHKINHGGQLADLDGRSLFAINMNSNVFYLTDRTPGHRLLAHGLTAKHSCPDTVAMK